MFIWEGEHNIGGVEGKDRKSDLRKKKELKEKLGNRAFVNVERK